MIQHTIRPKGRHGRTGAEGHDGTAARRGQCADGRAIGVRDVARRAGVSTATVSRVLNGTPTVAAPYRERVLQAMAELQYHPNRLARNLRRQQAEMIGVLVADVENPHFAQMVRVVEDAAFAQGYRVLLCNTDETAAKQRAYLEMLLAEHVAAVVLSPSDPQGDEIAAVLNRGIPLIAFDRPVADPRADAVLVDNGGAGRLATEHLRAAGHTRIGFISDPEVATGVERLGGYKAVMRAAGLQPCAQGGHSRIDGGMAATAALLRAHPDLTALILGNNLMALGALKALRAQGVRIPQDVALVALDDPFWAEVVDPPLTTLAQPVRAMARSVADLLLDRLRTGRTQPQRVVFDFELCPRASVGPPLTVSAL